MKNKMPNSTNEYAAETGADSNAKFKWSDDLVEDYSKLSVIEGVSEQSFQRRQTMPIRGSCERNCEN